MFHELSVTVRMKAMALGHPLDLSFARVEERFAFWRRTQSFSCCKSKLAAFSSLTSDEVRDLANAIVLHVVLLCTLLGYRMVRTDEDGRPGEYAYFRACPSRDSCGLIPAMAGIAGPGSCAFLQE